ncbi:GNAT family N-acetyltransferase [Ruegeria marina]|uniref:Protein N-acetyltransferase, RimJ/RimL family n=1 Tax=Ruegeria marina TaxID=639004 RepID=A0A1G6QZ35_9RHOB|nr:GNAT family protein [Ruegeria marina]SDC97649.1 Protein N-acetyltransferase, RimJ/RimL family [Ruegeria marina]
MDHATNHLGQPIGFALPEWQKRPRPDRRILEGRFTRLEPLDAASHSDDLWQAFATDIDGRSWTYMPFGPFAGQAAFAEFLADMSRGDDPVYYAILDRTTGRALGIASFMRIQPEHGVIEVGGIAYAPPLQRTPAATEAMYLMMAHAFDDLGYRRYEWKCDALNAPSRRAAARLGFTHDGLFEQAIVYKGRNRDTAWFSILDRNWPKVQRGVEAWLSPENFDAGGNQRRSLVKCRA